MSKREYRGSAPQLPPMLKQRSDSSNIKPPNLDYLSLNNTPVSTQPPSPIQSRNQHAANSHAAAYPTSAYAAPKTATATPTEWEVLLGSYDDRHLYDAIYGGGPGAPAPALSMTDTNSQYGGGWSPETWDMTSLNVGDFASGIAPPQSVLSFSEESLSSGEELSASELGLSGHLDYRHGLISSTNPNEQYLLDGLDATFGL